jgi:hypothetical protein
MVEELIDLSDHENSVARSLNMTRLSEMKFACSDQTRFTFTRSGKLN